MCLRRSPRGPRATRFDARALTVRSPSGEPLRLRSPGELAFTTPRASRVGAAPNHSSSNTPMLLNRIEKAMMNNPVRAALQRHFEAPRLRAMGGPVQGARVLEVGCGRGVGTGLILDLFGAARVDAFDLDPEMVALARRRLAPRGARVRLWTGDAARMEAPDGAYDAVFDFGIIHHVPAWRDALREVHRVLRPGGRFYAEEVLARFIGHPVWRRLLEHPQHDRFDYDTFRAALDVQGFRVVASRELFGQFAWFVADKPDPDESAVAAGSPSRTSDPNPS